MPASIKRNQTDPSDEGARAFPGITSGKDYPVQGFSGGGAIVVNDDGKFLHVGFSDIDAGWTVTVDKDKKPETDKKASSTTAGAAVSGPSAPKEGETTT